MPIAAIAEMWHLIARMVPDSWWQKPDTRRKRMAVWVYDTAHAWAIRRRLEVG